MGPPQQKDQERFSLEESERPSAAWSTNIEHHSMDSCSTSGPPVLYDQGPAAIVQGEKLAKDID